MPNFTISRPFKESSTVLLDQTTLEASDQCLHNSKNHLITANCLQVLQGLKSNICSLIIGSPPYPGKFQRYKIAGKLWGDFMEQVILESCRVSSGYTVMVVNGTVKQGRYLTEVEELLSNLGKYKTSIRIERPLIWIKNSPPNRKDWFCNAWEYIICFRNPRTAKFHFDWESIASPPKYNAGGRFRQRTSSGERRLGGEYPQGKLARPRDILHATVGGGHMGSPLAHSNEAPFPEALITPLILSLSPEKSRVLDPFLGSGTTFAVAHRHNRLFTGVDCRASQILLTLKRMKSEFPNNSK